MDRTVILSNAAKCLKCDTVVESKHVHDFVRCPCGNVFVDGGLDYLRRGVNDESKFLELSETEPATTPPASPEGT